MLTFSCCLSPKKEEGLRGKGGKGRGHNLLILAPSPCWRKKRGNILPGPQQQGKTGRKKRRGNGFFLLPMTAPRGRGERKKRLRKGRGENGKKD